MAVDGDVDGFDIGEQHGGRSVLLHHTQTKWWVSGEVNE